MPFTTWFKDSVVKNVPDADKPTLGSDPTAALSGGEPLGSVSPKDVASIGGETFPTRTVGGATSTLWHGKGSKS